MKRRTLKVNVAINIFGALAPLAVSLITIPAYVNHIGDARYGVLSIVWIMLGYFGFLDLGLSRAAANALARLRDAPQRARARVLVTTLVLNFTMGILGSLCLAIFGNYLLQHVLAVPDALKPEIRHAFPWIVALVPLALVAGVGTGALESRERFLLANLLQASGMSLGQIAPLILAVIVSPALNIVIAAAAAARALTVVAILIAVYREEGPLRFTDFELRQAKRLLNYGGWVSISGIISPLLTSLDQFLIGAVMNVAEVAHYAVPMSLVTRSQIFAGALARTLFPRMSNVGPEEARHLASRALLSLAYGYGAICAPAIIMAPIFFRCWIGNDFAVVAAPVAQILFFGAWINGVAYVPFALLQGQGRPDITGKLHAAELLPFIGILCTLTSAYGLLGAALAWNLRCAADAAFLLWVAEMSKRALLQAIVLPFLLLLGSAVIARMTNLDQLEALGASTFSGLTGLGLALLMAPDLRTLFVTAVLRVIHPLDRSPAQRV